MPDQMNVLLLSPPLRTRSEERGSLPLGLGYLSGVLNERGIPNTIADLSGLPVNYLNSELSRILDSARPRILGLTSLTSNFDLACAIADRVKQKQAETVVILGGVHATLQSHSGGEKEAEHRFYPPP